MPPRYIELKEYETDNRIPMPTPQLIDIDTRGTELKVCIDGMKVDGVKKAVLTYDVHDVSSTPVLQLTIKTKGLSLDGRIMWELPADLTQLFRKD